MHTYTSRTTLTLTLITRATAALHGSTASQPAGQGLLVNRVVPVGSPAAALVIHTPPHADKPWQRQRHPATQRDHTTQCPRPAAPRLRLKNGRSSSAPARRSGETLLRSAGLARGQVCGQPVDGRLVVPVELDPGDWQPPAQSVEHRL